MEMESCMCKLSHRRDVTPQLVTEGRREVFTVVLIVTLKLLPYI
jgi:hypothetical protein